MQFEEPMENERMYWPLERIQHDFADSVRSLPGLSKGMIDEVVQMFNMALLLVCVSRGKSLAHLIGEYCFRVEMRAILRKLPEPASPEVILEAGAGLDLIREYISDPVACLDRMSRWAPKIVCPPKAESDDWICWTPSHFSIPGGQPTIHPWT